MSTIIPFDDRDGSLWYDGKLVPWRDAKTHVLTHGLHYASSVFEGERLYSGRIYKLEEHTARLFESARILGMEIPYTPAEIDAACYEAARAQDITNGYVRPVVFRGSEMMAVAAQHTKIHVAIAVWQWPSYFDPATKLKGIRLTISDWKRPAPDTAPTKAKAAGLYMICTLSKHAAEAAGLCRRADVRLSRLCGGSDRRERVLRQRRRAAHADAGLFPRRHHAPLGYGAWRARGRSRCMSATSSAKNSTASTECFLTGTAAEVTPVSEIGPHKFKPGKISETLMNDYEQDVHREVSAVKL